MNLVAKVLIFGKKSKLTAEFDALRISVSVSRSFFKGLKVSSNTIRQSSIRLIMSNTNAI